MLMRLAQTSVGNDPIIHCNAPVNFITSVGPNSHTMADVDTILLLDEAKKQTQHLRAIRNWVAFAGIMFIVIPLSIWFIIFLGLGGILAGAF